MTRGRNRRGGSTSDAPTTAPSKKVGSWQEWNNQTSEEQAGARTAAAKRGGETPLWKLRRNLMWKPQADVPVEDRNPKVDALDYEPIRMRFIRQTEELCLGQGPDGEFDDDIFFSYYATWVKIGFNKYIISNSHNGELQVPCLLWARASMELDDEKRKSFIASQDFGIEVELLEDFHVIEIKKPGSQYGYDRWYRCGGQDNNGKSDCRHCDDGSETVFGQKVFWTLWAAQKRQLEEEIAKIETTCGNCKDGNVSVFGFTCATEGCEHVFGHKKEGIEYDEEQEDTFMNEEVTCPECKTTDFAEPLMECVKRVGFASKMRWVNSCDDPVLSDPYDLVLTMRTKKAGNSSAYEITDFEFVEDDDLPELTGIPESLQKLDVFALYGQMSMADQAQALDMKDKPPFDLDDAQAVLDAYYAAPIDEDDSDSEAVDE